MNGMCMCDAMRALVQMQYVFVYDASIFHWAIGLYQVINRKLLCWQFHLFRESLFCFFAAAAVVVGWLFKVRVFVSLIVH